MPNKTKPAPTPSRDYLKPPDGAIPSKSKLPTLYCSKCGAVLINHFKEIGYDPGNGRQLFFVQSVCPNRKRWLDGHKKYWREDYYPEGSAPRYYYADGTEA